MMAFIFDMGAIEESIMKVGYDPKKLPLGNLSAATIKSGYEALKDLEEALKKKKLNKKEVSKLSSAFYR